MKPDNVSIYQLTFDETIQCEYSDETRQCAYIATIHVMKADYVNI